MSKITDYLKKPTCREKSSPPQTNTNINTQNPVTESSNLDSGSSIVNEVPVQCQPGADYSFPLKVFGKRKT